MNSWATDISYKYSVNGEITNEQVVNQSIESILGTGIGERPFNLLFGSNFKYKILNVASLQYGEEIIDDVVNSLKVWEDRITIQEDKVRLYVEHDKHMVTLVIPYIIKMSGQSATFQKRITN